VQEFNSFRRKTRSKALHEFKLHRQEKLLWHGNTAEALERLVNLSMDLSLILAHSAAAAKVADGLSAARCDRAGIPRTFRQTAIQRPDRFSIVSPSLPDSLSDN